MAGTGTVNLNIQTTNLSIGQILSDLVVPLSNVVGEVLTASLTPGDNTIDVPTGSSFMLIIPSTTNTAQIRLAGASGLVSPQWIPLHKTNFSLIALDTTTPPATLVLNASTATGATVAFL